MRTHIFVLVAIFSLSLVSSLSMDASYDTKVIIEEIQNPILLTLQIDGAPAGDYDLYTLADIHIDPSQIFSIDGSSVVKEFVLSPNENFNAKGTYTFTYTLHQLGVEKVEERLTVEVLSLADIVEVGSDSIDPSSADIRFYIHNTRDVQISNITARFSSILFDISEVVNLKPFEKKYIDVRVDETKLRQTKAGVYIIDAVFETPQGNVKSQGNLYLGEKKGITTTEDSAGFLINTKTINKVNAGNVLENVEITITKNMITRLLTSFNAEPHFVSRDGPFVEYKWVKQRLGPGEVFTVKATTNYLIPFLVVLGFFLVFTSFRRVTQKKLEITKSVSPVKTKNGEFALRVRVHLKARKSLENVTIIDRVPAIVKIYKKFGTPQPDKIDFESRRLHWRIGDLEVGEERALSYIVYSKVGYVGKFSLPPALGVFEVEGDLHEASSNTVFFMSDQASDES